MAVLRRSKKKKHIQHIENKLPRKRIHIGKLSSTLILVAIVAAISLCTYLWGIVTQQEEFSLEDYKQEQMQSRKIKSLLPTALLDPTIVQVMSNDASSTSAASTLRRSVAEVKVPILIYHRIQEYKEKDSKMARIFITTPSAFEEQMKYLHDHDYTTISPNELMKAFNGLPLPNKPVIITFDDGYKGQYLTALPILEKYHDSATFFIYTDAVSAYGDYMTWEQVQDLNNHGMTIAAHTKSHAKLTKILTKKGLELEIMDSKKILEKKINTPVNYFAYPYGLYNSEVIDVVKESGFLAAFGVTQGKIEKANNMYFLRRNNMGSSFDIFLRAIQ